MSDRPPGGDEADRAPGFVPRDGGARIACRHTRGRAPTVVFLSGYASDMTGTKAVHLARWAAARGQAFLRFDYQGHGASSGRFEDGTIGLWAGDARAAIEAMTTGPVVLVGSSMGGWQMLLVARALGSRVAGLLGIAAAPDFTEDLIRPSLSADERHALETHGAVTRPSAYDEGGYVVTRALLDEATAHLQLRAAVPIACPVRLVHGMADADVPWRTSTRLAERLASDDVQVTLLKASGHRLSEPDELAVICARLEELL